MAEQGWKERYREQLNKRKKSEQVSHAATSKSQRVDKFDVQPSKTTPAHPAARPRLQRQTDVQSAVRLICKIIIAIWLGITGIQIVIWLLTGMFGKQFPDPWWLWTGVSGAIVVGVVWYVNAEIQNRKRRSNK